MSQAKPLFSEAGLAPLFRFFVTPLAFCFFAQKKLAHLSVVSRRRGAPVYAKRDLHFFNFRMSRTSGPLALKKVRMSRTVFLKISFSPAFLNIGSRLAQTIRQKKIRILDIFFVACRKWPDVCGRLPRFRFLTVS